MRILLWAFLGALFGTALDAVHVLTGTLAYAHPVMGLQDWWVLPEFAIAGVVLGMTHRHIAMPAARRHVPDATRAEVGRSVTLFVLVYAASGFFRAYPNAELLGFTALFVVGVLWTPEAARPSLLLHACGSALMGPLCEIIISSTGTFHYNASDVAGVPRWLPCIYLHAALASHVLDRFLLGKDRAGGVA